MIDTEWFEGRSADQYERDYWWRIATEMACAVVLGIVLAGISGCATTKEEPRQEVCFFQYLGRTESGLSVAKTVCMTPEAFAESQK